MLFILILGERLNEKETEEILKDCLDPEDDDGMIPYVRKYLTDYSLHLVWYITIEDMKKAPPCSL